MVAIPFVGVYEHAAPPHPHPASASSSSSSRPLPAPLGHSQPAATSSALALPLLDPRICEARHVPALLSRQHCAGQSSPRGGHEVQKEAQAGNMQRCQHVPQRVQGREIRELTTPEPKVWELQKIADDVAQHGSQYVTCTSTYQKQQQQQHLSQPTEKRKAADGAANTRAPYQF